MVTKAQGTRIWHSYITQQPKICQIYKGQWVRKTKNFLHLLGAFWSWRTQTFYPNQYTVQTGAAELMRMLYSTAPQQESLFAPCPSLAPHSFVYCRILKEGFALILKVSLHWMEIAESQQTRLFLKIPQSKLTGWSMVCNLTSKWAGNHYLTWVLPSPLVYSPPCLCWQNCWEGCALKQIREPIQPK